MIRILKYIVLLELLLLLTGICSAKYDSLFSTTYYRQKVSQFRLIADDEEGEIIFLGQYN